MSRFITAVATTALVAGIMALGGVPASASCHIVNFSETNYIVPESAGSVTIQIRRQIFGNGCPGTMNYSTEDDTANDPSDYKKTSGTFAYATTEASKSFTVPIVNDSEQEGDETFKVTFNGSSPGPVTGSATVTIKDDDAGAPQGPATAVDAQADDEAAGEEEDEGTSVGLIAAIAGGAIVLVLIVVLLSRRKPA
jgi:hypothetical protein